MASMREAPADSHSKLLDELLLNQKVGAIECVMLVRAKKGRKGDWRVFR